MVSKKRTTHDAAPTVSPEEDAASSFVSPERSSFVSLFEKEKMTRIVMSAVSVNVPCMLLSLS
jgi:hypothetical protein